MGELWARYQHEYEKQQKLRELRNSSGFKDKVDLQLKLLRQLRANWRKFTSAEKLLFSESFSYPIEIYDENKPFWMLPNIDFSFFDHAFPENEAKEGSPPAYANEAICKFLIDSHSIFSGKKPTLYKEHPSIKYAVVTLNELKDYVYELEVASKDKGATPAGKQLLDFKSVKSKCLETIKKYELGKELVPKTY
jgi:hypothetical protein